MTEWGQCQIFVAFGGLTWYDKFKWTSFWYEEGKVIFFRRKHITQKQIILKFETKILCNINDKITGKIDRLVLSEVKSIFVRLCLTDITHSVMLIIFKGGKRNKAEYILFIFIKIAFRREVE